MPLRALIAGGHTGGHITCGLAIADGIQRARPGAAILFAGAHGGPEVAATRAAGHAIETVWIGGIDRRFSVRGLARNLLLPLQLAVSRNQAGRIVAGFKPDVVIGVGAYPSAPVVAAAQRARIPTLLHEANAQPGIANRFLARRAKVICVGVEAAARWFPPGKTVLTGNPVRPGLAGPPPPEARRRLGLEPGLPTVLVLGGSLGSTALNRWVPEQARRLAGLQLLWQSGRAHHAACAAALGDAPGVRLVPYLDDMAAAYAAADLVVTAAGALTLAELCHLGKPAIVVPASDVAEDHQQANVPPGVPTVRDDELDARLLDLASRTVRDPDRLRSLGTHMRSLARPDAAALIVAEILKLAGGS